MPPPSARASPRAGRTRPSARTSISSASACRSSPCRRSPARATSRTRWRTTPRCWPSSRSASSAAATEMTRTSASGSTSPRATSTPRRWRTCSTSSGHRPRRRRCRPRPRRQRPARRRPDCIPRAAAQRVQGRPSPFRALALCVLTQCVPPRGGTRRVKRGTGRFRFTRCALAGLDMQLLEGLAGGALAAAAEGPAAVALVGELPVRELLQRGNAAIVAQLAERTRGADPRLARLAPGHAHELLQAPALAALRRLGVAVRRRPEGAARLLDPCVGEDALLPILDLLQPLAGGAEVVLREGA